MTDIPENSTSDDAEKLVRDYRAKKRKSWGDYMSTLASEHAKLPNTEEFMAGTTRNSHSDVAELVRTLAEEYRAKLQAREDAFVAKLVDNSHDYVDSLVYEYSKMHRLRDVEEFIVAAAVLVNKMKEANEVESAPLVYYEDETAFVEVKRGILRIVIDFPVPEDEEEEDLGDVDEDDETLGDYFDED